MPVFEEKTIEDAVTYRATGHIEVRNAVIVLRDGVEIARTLHRKVITPGDDVKAESATSKAVAALWSAEQINKAKPSPQP